MSWAEFLADVSALAKGLVAAGVEAGDRIALISKTRYEWVALDYAIWYAGAVTVPVYETSSTEELGRILADSGAILAVAETSDHVTRVEQVLPDLPALRRVVCLDNGGLETFTCRRAPG